MSDFAGKRRGLSVGAISAMAAIVLVVAPASFGRRLGVRGGAQRTGRRAATRTATVDAQADRIIARYIQALGGEGAFHAIHSYSMTGTIEVPAQGLTGKVQAFAKAPNKYALTEDIPGLGKFNQGFDGRNGWSQDPMNGSRELSGTELAQFRREANLYHDVELKRLYTSIKYQGTDNVDGKPVQVLVATPPEGGTEKFYFDTQTGLLLRTDLTLDSPEGKFPVQTYTDDYRSVGGAKFPFLLRSVLPVAAFTIKFSEIKANVAVSDSVFAKP